MDFLELIKSAVLGIIQGITEWLPISSTGHMILADKFLSLNVRPEFWNLFLVVIQFGSILAVLTLYFHKLNPFSHKKNHQQRSDTYSLWLKVLVAVIPAGIAGVFFDDILDRYLNDNAIVVSIALIVYGVLFIILENRNKKPSIESFDQLSYKTALFIGLFQVLSLVPGTSRSGSTILGAVFLGASRYVAAEFSFFLAVPVMFGASGLKIVKYVKNTGVGFSGQEWAIMLVGMVVAFIVSIFAIKFLMGYIKKHDFKAFGYYRIILGIIVLVYFFILVPNLHLA